MQTSDLIQQIEPIIKEAGTILVSYFQKSFNYKLVDGHYVTDADLKSEQFLKRSLGEILPQASFIAEESGKSGDSEYCFVIDPLDGTTNFVQGIPYFCISVALTFNNQPILATVYDPLRDEFFFAQRGLGAFLNGNKINISNKRRFSDCCIATNISYLIKDINQLSGLLKVRNNALTMRVMGSAALDQAYVACGRLDGAFFNELKWWDVAAGMLLIGESGGIVTDFGYDEITPDFKSYVAGQEEIYNQLIKFLN